MKYTVDHVVGNGKIGRDASFETSVVKEYEPGSTYPEPARQFDTKAEAEAYAADPVPFQQYVDAELKRLEGADLAAHRGLKEYVEFLGRINAGRQAAPKAKTAKE
jgi:hypothetical protein